MPGISLKAKELEARSFVESLCNEEDVMHSKRQVKGAMPAARILGQEYEHKEDKITMSSMNAAEQHASRILYVALSGAITEKVVVKLMNVADENGFEAWRGLTVRGRGRGQHRTRHPTPTT